MSRAAFKLESFSEMTPMHPAMIDPDAIHRAYLDGLAEGRAAGFSAELRGLADAIIALEAGLSNADAIRAEARRNTLDILTPLLHEIVAALAETGSSAMLEAALSREIHAILADAPATAWHVLCAPGMESVIRRCARAAGTETADIRSADHIEEAQIVMDEGRIVFSRNQVAARFRDLISELQESLS